MSYTPINWKNDIGEPVSAENLNHMEDGILNAVYKNGDTMTGSLILKGSPSEDDEAATKDYIEKYTIRHITISPDYTWRDYSFVIPKHAAKDMTLYPVKNNSDNNIINGKFHKVIFHKLYVEDTAGYKFGYTYPCREINNETYETIEESVVFSLDELNNEVVLNLGYGITFTFKLENNILTVGSQWENSFYIPNSTLYFSVI